MATKPPREIFDQHMYVCILRDNLALAVDPDRYADMEGTTDTEMLLFLALTFGLDRDPRAAVAAAVGLIEDVGRRHGIEFPIQMTVATTDGDTTWRVIPAGASGRGRRSGRGSAEKRRIFAENDGAPSVLTGIGPHRWQSFVC